VHAARRVRGNRRRDGLPPRLIRLIRLIRAVSDKITEEGVALDTSVRGVPETGP